MFSALKSCGLKYRCDRIPLYPYKNGKRKIYETKAWAANKAFINQKSDARR